MVGKPGHAGESYRFEPIGVIRSCFQEKFGIPRQPGLVPEAGALLELFPPFDRAEALAGLEGFSHVWVIFVFHGIEGGSRGLTARPPRLGGNRRVGVLATRSMFRPNPIGLSVLRLEGIERGEVGARLRLGGVDLLDGTPVLDVKPYLPYADSLPEARGGYAEGAPPPLLRVAFGAAAERLLDERAGGPDLRRLIERVLALDPRPAYRVSAGGRDSRVYGMRLHGVEVRWRVEDGEALVVEVRDAGD